ncbi:MAG: hypothetical protein M3122_09210 [Actinomycetota bacterium]|nr:hypothetical protein [Actinomycetota bacterium]
MNLPEVLNTKEDVADAVHSRPARYTGRFGTNDLEMLIARHGWEASMTQPGEEKRNSGVAKPMVLRDVPGLPQSSLITALRS